MARTELEISPRMRFIVFPLLIALALAFIGYALLQGAPQHLSLISVSASGSVSANPTQSVISLNLNATGNTAGASTSNLSTVAGALNATLQPFLGGNSSRIKTLSYSVLPVSACVPYPIPYPVVYPSTTVYPPTTVYCQPTIRGYAATEYVQVTIPNIGETNAALQQVSAIRGVSISGVSARLSAQQQENMSQQALSLALHNATSQAQTLAGPGASLRIQNITVSGGYIYYPAVLSAASSLASNQTFFSGTATVTKNIYVVFSMH